MKALFAVILLASSTVFAQATTPAAAPTPEEQAANILVVSCAVQKFCDASAYTALDQQFITVQADASKLLNNMTCTDIDAIWANPDAITAIKDFSAAVTGAGETTCLSVVQ